MVRALRKDGAVVEAYERFTTRCVLDAVLAFVELFLMTLAFVGFV
jgi:hypothetical protein